MSDTAQAAASEPTATQTTVQQQATAPATTSPATSASASSDAEPAWLASRLERERKAILRELGVENPGDVRAAIAAWKASQEALKTEEQRKAERLAELEQRATRAAALEAVVKAQADAAAAALDETQRAAVLRLAGDDPARVIDAIAALRPTWASAKGQPPTVAPIPAPANTAPSAAAPPPSSVAQVDHAARYEELCRTAPHRAALYLLEHREAIANARKARG